MAIISTQDVKTFLKKIEGKEITLTQIRKELRIKAEDKSFDAIRNILFQLSEQGIIKASGKRDGIWHVIKRVEPVPIFSVQRERRPPFQLFYPTDFDTSQPFSFADNVVVREGDCILIAGESNWGKTTLAMNFLAANIGYNPVLLGNEFTKDNEPTPRFLNRLDTIDWVSWVDETGQDMFTLLPVYQDFAENIIKDRINIIDWINIQTGEHYMIGNIMEEIKTAVGKGIAIIVIQKAAGSESGRGGQFTKDFADLELLIDKHTNMESRLTIGKCKEYTSPVTGRSWAYEISKGVQLRNVREVIKCPACFGKGWQKFGTTNKPCERCQKIGWVSK
jgi:hypothetical protein